MGAEMRASYWDDEKLARLPCTPAVTGKWQDTAAVDAPMPWNSRLRHPIHFADSRVLRTLADARDMVLSLPERAGGVRTHGRQTLKAEAHSLTTACALRTGH
jgi:hypothetical protein